MSHSGLCVKMRLTRGARAAWRIRRLASLQAVFADEAADEERSAGENKPSGERNAGESWHSSGPMKSFWHSFGTVEGRIGPLESIRVAKSRIINTHERSGRSAAW